MYYIKGVKGRGKEIIALLEEKGGNAHGGYEGDCEEYIYYIDKNGDINFDFVDAIDVFQTLGEELKLPEKEQPRVIDSDGREVDAETLKNCCYFARLNERKKMMKVAMEVYADLLSAKGYDIGTVNAEIKRLEEKLLEKHADEELTLSEKTSDGKYKVGDAVKLADTIANACKPPYGVIDAIGEGDNEGSYHLTCVRPHSRSEAWVYKDQISGYWKPTRGDSVLVRNNAGSKWVEAVFSFFDDTNIYITVGGHGWKYCIPFDEEKLGKRC